MKLLLFLILIVVSVTTVAYAQFQDVIPSEKDFVPYTENYNVRFDADGNIDFDLLIAEIMPEIFEKKLRSLGINVGRQDIVLERGPQIAMYQPRSYNCGYVIDNEKNNVYWLEAAINSTHIEYAKIYEIIPRDRYFEVNYTDCFSPLEIQVAEIYLQEKLYFTPDEEARAASTVKHYLRGNDNLNKLQFKIGKFNFDYKDEDILSFCGKFEGKMAGSNFFSGMIDGQGNLDFGLERSMSSLCAIDENAILYDIKFHNEPNTDNSLQTWKNIRSETVYLKPSSVEKLLERNYMYTENVHNMIFAYSTSFEVDFIDFRPDASGTLFYFDHLEQDTFAKIRVPQNGANYYMSYGPNEWNVGDITKVVISVEEDDPEYKQQPFVKSPDAPYPQYFTDYIFKVPKDSTMMAIVLEIENYKPDEDHDPDEWAGYRP